MNVFIHMLLLAAPALPVIAPSPELAVSAVARGQAGKPERAASAASEDGWAGFAGPGPRYPKMTRATFIGMPRPGPGVDFSATLLDSNAADRITVMVEGRVKGAAVARQVYELSLSSTGSMVVPTRAIPKGTTIAASDLVLKELELGGPQGRFASDLGDVIGRIAKVTLLPDRPVPLAELDVPNAVARGEEVKVAIKAGGMEVTIMAEALESGGIGERIRARNRSTQKILSALVVGPGQLEANTQ